MASRDIVLIILAGTCVLVFVATSVITLLALTRRIKLANVSYLKRLFVLLIVEVVAISVLAFKEFVFPPVKVECPSCPVACMPKVAITGRISEYKYNNVQAYTVNGAYFSCSSDPTMNGYFQIDGGERRELGGIETIEGKIFKVDVPYQPSKEETLKVVMQISENDTIATDSILMTIWP